MNKNMQNMNTRYSFLIFHVRYAKCNKAFVNLGYFKLFFKIHGPLKTLNCHFRKFFLSNFKMTLANIILVKPPFYGRFAKFF